MTKTYVCAGAHVIYKHPDEEKLSATLEYISNDGERIFFKPDSRGKLPEPIIAINTADSHLILSEEGERSETVERYLTLAAAQDDNTVTLSDNNEEVNHYLAL